MVKIMENPIKMDDLGGKPLFSETSMYHPPKERKSATRMEYVFWRKTEGWKKHQLFN